MKGGLGGLMKQAQKMQEDLQRVQAELANEETTGESGGGMVKITMNGKHQVARVEIDGSLLEDDKDMLEDLVAAAINDTVTRIAEKTKESMANVTSGLPLPPGFKLPM